MPIKMSWSIPALLATTLAATGCTGAADRICEAKAACEGFTDSELEQCVAQLDAQDDHAGAMECADEWDAFLRCGEDEGTCEDGDWSFGDECDTEQAAYNSCMGVVPGDDDDSASTGDDDDSASTGDDDDSASTGDDDDSAPT